MAKKSHSVDVVADNVYTTLQKAAEKNKTSVRGYVNDLLSNAAEANIFLSKKFKHLTKVEQSKEEIILRDKDKGFAAVMMENGKLQCSLCPKNLVCDHITYALIDPSFWTVPQVDNK